MAYYGTLSEANTYFDGRLHSESWGDSTPSDRPKALAEASQLIDQLNYKGVKHTVWLIDYDQSDPYDRKYTDKATRDAIIVADGAQELEFPRGQDTIVPEEIEWACYETALAMIEGFDPEDAADRMGISRQGYSAVRTTYASDSLVQEYLVYGIPTARVWRWLKPYLVDDRSISFSRAN